MRAILVLLIACALMALAAQVAAAEEFDAGAVAITHEPPADETIELGAGEAPAEIPGVPDIEGDPIGSVEQFVSAIKAGNWKMVGSLALALIMVLLAKARKKVKWFSGDRGGAILVMLLGLLGGFSAALASGDGIDWKLAVGVIGLVWTGVGGVTWLKRVIWPKDAEA
jgi:hypothetical protein